MLDSTLVVWGGEFGLDHKRLTLLHDGREERPTINGGVFSRKS